MHIFKPAEILNFVKFNAVQVVSCLAKKVAWAGERTRNLSIVINFLINCDAVSFVFSTGRSKGL
jgi:hypothetical protein